MILLKIQAVNHYPLFIENLNKGVPTSNIHIGDISIGMKYHESLFRFTEEPIV